MQMNKDAVNEVMTACSMCEQMIDQLFPAVIQVLKSEDIMVAMTVVPFLMAYILRTKIQQKR